MDVTTVITTARAFFDAQGAIANAIGIGTPVVAGSAIFYRKYIRPRRPKTFKSVRDWVELRFGLGAFELNRAVLSMLKLAIVDDKPDDFPVEFLRQSGYDLTVIEKISLADVNRLLEYDLVLMDITNVVVEDSARGGLELIRRLKASLNPPVVIAVSAKRYDPTVTEFFKLADYHMKKPVKAADLDAAIKKLLTERNAPGCIATSMDKVMSSAFGDEYKRSKCVKRVISSLEKSQITSSGLDGDSSKAMTKLCKEFTKFARYYDVK